MVVLNEKFAIRCVDWWCTAELDSFKGSIVDFFNPDTLCTAIKLCDEVRKPCSGTMNYSRVYILGGGGGGGGGGGEETAWA